jgi:hypothetical protein
LEVTNNSKLKLVMKCKDSNCSWKMYVTPNITNIWEIIRNLVEHYYFDSATRADHTLVHRYCIQHITQNMYKDCHMKRINVLFKQAARHKKSWRCEEYMKKLITLDQHLISSSEKQKLCKVISQHNKCPIEGHEITETAINNPLQLRKCQPRNFIMWN